jgi:hypothetical protein
MKITRRDEYFFTAGSIVGGAFYIGAIVLGMKIGRKYVAPWLVNYMDED